MFFRVKVVGMSISNQIATIMVYSCLHGKTKPVAHSSDGYAYLVPFVEQEDHFFLKTVIPSRKATRDYLNQGEHDAED